MLGDIPATGDRSPAAREDMSWPDAATGRRPATLRRPGSPGRDHLRGHDGLHLAPTASCVRPLGPTAHRRFTEWTGARVWAKPHRLVLDELGARGELDWSRCSIDSVNMRALKGGR